MAVQYTAALVITVAIRCSSKGELYQELRLETLQQRRWYKKLCSLYKILKLKLPRYLDKLVSVPRSIRTRKCEKIP